MENKPVEKKPEFSGWDFMLFLGLWGMYFIISTFVGVVFHTILDTNAEYVQVTVLAVFMSFMGALVYTTFFDKKGKDEEVKSDETK